MKVGLQVGNGALVGPQLLDEIRERGFQMVRIQAFLNDPPHFTLTDPDLTRAMVQEVLDAGLEPLTMIRHASQLAHIPEGTDVEFGNEPDLGSQFGWPSREDFLWALETVASAAGHVRLWSPAISNLNGRGFKFLESMHWERIPASVNVSFHRYPDGDDPNPSKPNKERRFRGPDHRDREIEELKRIVGPRKIACTELGYHTAHGATDADVARSMAFERALLERHGVEFAIAYQVISADPRTTTHHDGYFGFRAFDVVNNTPLGPWKPVTEAWTGVPL